jgi:hypothetical protein
VALRRQRQMCIRDRYRSDLIQKQSLEDTRKLRLAQQN